MKVRLSQAWERLRSSYWFLPTVMALGAVGLSLATEAVDRAVDPEALLQIGWIYTGGPEGARALLSTIAGSMITVAGVAFSVTMVALVLASSQFGPRILGNFMKDRGNQIVLGTFTATFLYCLLALRTVRGTEDFEFVPYLSITMGIALGLASIGVLIYFIDHVANSIQAPEVVARVGRDMDAVVSRTFPPVAEEEPGAERAADTGAERAADTGDEDGEETRGDASGGSADEPPTSDRRPIRVRGDGYIQFMDMDRLLQVATEADITISLLRRMGDYAVEGSVLAEAWPADRVDDDVAARAADTLALGSVRTASQDPDFVTAQLVEVAVRALSPGINDPFTAVNCVDRLASALARVARRPPPTSRHLDEEGHLRVISRPATFELLTCTAFDQIREHGRTSTAVLERLLVAIAELAPHVRREEDRRTLVWHAEKVHKSGAAGIPEEPGRERIRTLYGEALQALGEEEA